MENVLRPLIVVGGSLVLTLLVGWIADLLLKRADQRHQGSLCGACCAAAACHCR